MNLIMLLLFALIMPILLMNLLVGLAIGDLMQIQQNARLKRLATQVQIHTNLEKKLPEKLIKRWTKNEMIVYLNHRLCNRTSSVLKRVRSSSSTCRQLIGGVTHFDFRLVDCQTIEDG